ncbi:MAG: sodium-independent anion transporter [Robiginitomaculum sp.]|nr:MAG: sodium-independent anion transporter [Robiginitomaculum sp.]
MSLRTAIYNNYEWLNGYRRGYLIGDFISAVILSVLLIPQSLAYALLAGLPPQVGLYAAIFPSIAYAFFGSSRFLAVGPVAITSLMTMAVISQMPEELRLISAAMLAIMAGGFLAVFGLLRGGSLATFFSRPVVSAYITGAAILIILSQIKYILQIEIEGRRFAEMVPSLISNFSDALLMPSLIGVGTILSLYVLNRYCLRWLRLAGLKKRHARLIIKLSPILVIAVATVATATLGLEQKHGVATVGNIPANLPHFVFPLSDLGHWKSLIVSALLISLVGFVDSVSIGQTLAARNRTRVDPNKELLGVGVANIAAGLTGAYPVAGSLSRSAINYSTGAKSPLVGVMTAVIVAIAVLTILPFLKSMPLATLAGLIIYSCFSLLNFKEIWQTWCYSKADAWTAIGAFCAVLLVGIQYGVLIGTILSMVFHIRLTLKPHTVEVGRFLGTEHYRDADLYTVEEFDEVKTLRIDESLYFANARFLEDTIAKLVVKYPKMENLVLMCPAVNRIDASALESLLVINARLDEHDIKLHLSELHALVRERLHRSTFLEKLTGEIFFTQHEAIEALRPEPDWSQFSDHIDIH